MTQKKLQKGSTWELLDKNGDGLVWFSAITVTVFIIVLMTPVVPIDRIDHLSGIGEIWILSNMGIIGSFIGFNQLAKRGNKGEDNGAIR